MRRIICLILTLIISLCTYIPCTFAEESEAAENSTPTRLEVFKLVAETFALQSDGDITPILSYNDWASVIGGDRYTVASVIKSGIFVPDTASLSPNAPMEKEDFGRLTFGLTLYGMATEGYGFISGELVSVNRKGITINDNHGNSSKFEGGIPVVVGTEIKDTFSGIPTGMTVEVLYDAEGNGVIGWVKRAGAATVKHFYKGNLYINDELSNSLIFNRLQVLRSDKWVTVSDRYLTGEICEETIIILNGKKVLAKDINRLYLDMPASVIVGEKYGKQCILYVLFE